MLFGLTFILWRVKQADILKLCIKLITTVLQWSADLMKMANENQLRQRRNLFVETNRPKFDHCPRGPAPQSVGQPVYLLA